MDLVAWPISVAVGTIFPAYASFKALDSKSYDQAALWLTYWTIFAALTVLESLFFWALKWLSLYYTFKLLFLLWLQAPQTRGSQVLYARYVHPALKLQEGRVDGLLAEGRRRLGLPRDTGGGHISMRQSSGLTDHELQTLEGGDSSGKGK